MVQVCQGTKTKNDMLEETLVQYKEMFIITRREFDKVVSVCLLFVVAQIVGNRLAQSVRRYLEGNGGNDGGNDDAPGGNGGGDGGEGRGRRGGRGRSRPARGRSAPRGGGGGRAGQDADPVDSDGG